MYFVKNILFTFLFVLTACSSLTAAIDYKIENQDLALEQALSLSNSGVLKQKENGFVYLDVSNQFITEVVPLIEHEGDLRKPPTAKQSVGAHISVFHEDEKITPDELGKTFSFTVKEIRSFTLHTRDGLKKLWVMAVSSPELEVLRQKYGLTPKLKNYDFHISLAKQMPKAPDNWQKITDLSQHNFSKNKTIGLETTGDFVPVPSKKIEALVHGLEGVGQLCLKNNGYVYLKVHNLFIDSVIEHLPLQQRFIPVDTAPKKLGAHISTILEDEMIGNEIWELEDIGKWFTFEVKELRYVDRKTAKGNSRLWLLAVDVPGLERLRAHYNLPPKVKKHDFHITLGTEVVNEISEVALAP
jgi:hypothetical protein